MRGAVCFLFLFLFSASAVALDMNGSFSQGGLVIGLVEPGATVSAGGKNLRVSKDGYFLLGFGRDAGPRMELKVTSPSGKTQPHMLKIAKRKYKIQRIDGLPKRQVTPDPEARKRIDADNAKIGEARRKDTPEAYFVSGFTWPVRGRISGVYGSQRILNGNPRNPHNGVDIAATKGTPIAAPADGLVVLVHQDMFYTGKTLIIDHGHGLTSVYAHMNEITVREGQMVAQGQVIGKVGASGRATGPHLHWGVTLFKTHLDPALIAGDMNFRD